MKEGETETGESNRILRAGDGVEKVRGFTPDFPVSCLCQDSDVHTTDCVVCTGLFIINTWMNV